ncbi:MAG: diguanylate cyclase [Deltaproteobacteria bacterium]|nr:diguanylate cyclase [Deltaproteobacteria bacterium]
MINILPPENYLEYIINSIPAQVYFKDVNLVYRWVNERFLQYKGMSRESILGKRDTEIYPLEQANNIIKEDRQVIESGFEIYYEHYSRNTDRYFAIRKTVVKNERQEIQGVLAVIMDITEEKRATAQLEIAKREIEESREKFRDILENANDFIISMETDGRILYANRAFTDTMRISESAIKNSNFFDFLNPHSREQAYMIFDSIMKGIKISHSEFILLTTDGRQIVAEGSCTYRQYSAGTKYILGIFRDITQRKNDEERIRFLAYHDVLTELPNRLLFFDRVNMEINRSVRNGTFIALIMMDLDKFKNINDRLGHNAGDAVLKEVSLRAKGVIRKIDTIARMGGDEFVIVLSDLKSIRDIEEIAERIIEEISRPYLVEGNTVEISPSLGISIFPEDGNEPDTLIRKADIAMYKSKTKGGKSYSYYSK